MKCHPDRCPDDPQAQEKFKEAKEAYEVLTDAQKARAYDQHGHAAFEGGIGAAAGGFQGDVGDIFGDIFSDIFGMGGGRGRAAARRRSSLSASNSILKRPCSASTSTSNCQRLSSARIATAPDPPTARPRPARPAAVTAACACKTASSRSSRPARIAAAAARRSPIRARMSRRRSRHDERTLVGQDSGRCR